MSGVSLSVSEESPQFVISKTINLKMFSGESGGFVNLLLVVILPISIRTVFNL